LNYAEQKTYANHCGAINHWPKQHNNYNHYKPFRDPPIKH